MKKSCLFWKTGAVAVGLLVVAGVPALAVTGPWVGDGKARVRLIAEGVDKAGRLHAGLEIDLDAGWHTYWRSPGDAGIAPVIDFSSSRNLGPVDVAFPLPARLDDGYAVSNIYQGKVILPLAAKLVDPAAGADLVLKLDLGVCADVCVPEHFDAMLRVPSAEQDAAAGAALDEAGKHLPGPPEAGVFAVTGVTRQGGSDKRPTFDVTAKVPDAEAAQVFVEGPADWYPNVPKRVSQDGGAGTYRVTFDRLTSKVPIAGTKLRVTIVAAGRAIEQWVPLD